MKKIFLTIFVFACTLAVSAQSDKYTDAMKKNIAQLDSALVSGKMNDLANNFERIGDAEKNQWRPYYFASYCTVMTALMEKDKNQVDAIADKANGFITKAQGLAGGENSEICVIKSMIATAHLTVNPPMRFQKYGKASDDYIQKAKTLDATNPRPVCLEGQNTFYKPKVFGGGKDKAKPYFVKAIEMFDKFVPASELDPAWGKASAQYFLSQCN